MRACVIVYPALMESNEAVRLRAIVEKLDTKLKSVLHENRELKQRLELAQLDQQLAEEQVQQSSATLADLQSRNAELEELRELGTELEVSLSAEKTELEFEIERLNNALADSHARVQSYENLRFELASSEQRLHAAQLNLEVMKNGVSSALAPMIDGAWLPLLDILQVPVQTLVEEYNAGNVSVKTLESNLLKRLNDFIDTMSFIPAKSIANLSSSAELDRVKARIEQIKAMQESIERSQEDPTISKSRESQEREENLNEALEEMRLRNLVLENKLREAQHVYKELSALSTWQKSASEREAQLRQQIVALQQTLDHREHELAAQRRKNLPAELAERAHITTITELHKTIGYLSRSPNHLKLSPLTRHSPRRISQFANNPRLAKLRKLARSLEGPKIDLEIRLMQL